MFNIKSKNIAILYSSMLIGGLLFFIPIIALYFEKSLFNITNVAIIFAVEAVAFVIFEIPTGAIADLFGRKKTIIFANMISVLAVVFLYIGGSMTMFILYGVINSLARSLGSGTDSALIYDTLKNENKERFYKKLIGRYHAIWPIGASIGSVIGGYMAKVSLSLPILMTFIPLSIATLLVCFLKEPYYEKDNHRNMFKHIRNSFKIILNSRQLLVLMIGGFVFMAFEGVLQSLSPLFFKFKEIPIEFFGWIAAFIFGFLSLGHFFSYSISKRIGNKKVLLISLVISSILLFSATITTKYVAIFIFVIPFIFFGLKNTIIDHLLNLEVSSGKRATIISTYSFVCKLGYAVIAPIIGYLAELYTINTAFQLSIFFMFIISILYFFIKDGD